MRYFSKMLCLGLLLIFFLFNFSIALAKPVQIQISQLETQIMPEYDTTDILILNSIKFNNTSKTDFSEELKWRIPNGSSKQIVTDNVDSNRHLQFDFVEGQDYDEMVWKLSKPLKPGESIDIHLEFYYNNFQGHPDKQFSFEINSPYPISSAQIFLLQPMGAANFKMNPDFGQPYTNQDWTYYVKTLGSLPQDQAFQMSASYTKADLNPSVPSYQSPGQSQNNQGVNNNFPSSHIWVIAIAVIAIILILVMAYVKIQQNNLRRYLEETEQVDIDAEGEEREQDNLVDVPEVKESTWLEDQKRQLQKKLEQGLILEVDYHEAIIELEEKANKKNS